MSYIPKNGYYLETQIKNEMLQINDATSFICNNALKQAYKQKKKTAFVFDSGN